MRRWISPELSLWLLGLLLIGFCLSDSAHNVKPPPHPGDDRSGNATYGIVFDAGSTGTRIHIYTFTQRTTGTMLHLVGEVFESVKPGLSAFADRPHKCTDTVRSLLDLAQTVIPDTHWHRTTVIFKATAGLRLLPQHQAQALLSEVRSVLHASPFLVPDDSVSILSGSDEGILAWIAVNLLTGRLDGHHTVGILDLGGASAQITFLPLSKITLDETSQEFLAKFELFNSSYRLYTRSYLGLGLKVARLAVLGVSESEVHQGTTFRSHCLLPALESEWSFSGVTYRYGGKTDGRTGFHSCYSEVLQVVRDELHRVSEIRDTPFYAFSYFYDRATESGLIDYASGGSAEVRDFFHKAEEVCDNMDNFTSYSPFLCMDLTYIAALLQEGFGLPDSTMLQLTKKMHEVEISWTLGAIYQVLQT
uniref:nucleoside diphosphate phosphatase n=1 Tax=Leptobrachium leishanense TaxID=445787 RepID=A0A8C5WAK5_9ANUR